MARKRYKHEEIVAKLRQRSAPQSDTSHQHQRCSRPHSPRGRLRYADWLRRPRWRNGQP